MKHLDAATLARAFDELPMGVVILDPEARVVFYNRYEEELAGRSRADVLGEDFFRSVAPCTRVTGLAEAFAAKIGREPFHVQLDFRFPRAHVPHACDVHLELLSVSIDGDDHGALLVQDVSSIRAVERTKDLLTRLLSHDMRSPLTAAFGNTDLALLDLDDKRAVEGYLRDSQLALQRLRSMLEDLNDVTHLKTRTLPHEFSTFDLYEVVDALIHEKLPRVREEDGQLVLHADSDSYLCRGNSRLISRAIDNLLENALIHGEGEPVSIRLRSDSDQVVVEVEDRGPGVPDSIAGSLYEPGSSLPQSPARSGNHRGLGLALVRMVADHHGGSIEHERPAGGGARFRLSLPVDGI